MISSILFLYNQHIFIIPPSLPLLFYLFCTIYTKLSLQRFLNIPYVSFSIQNSFQTIPLQIWITYPLKIINFHNSRHAQ